MHLLGDHYTQVLQQEPNGIKEPEQIYYHTEFHKEFKIEVNPLKLRSFLSDKCTQKVIKLTTGSKNGFPFKVKKNEELNHLYETKKFDDFSCVITFHKFLNQTKGSIDIQICEINEKFEKNT